MKFSKLSLISLICACCIGTGILAGALVLMFQPQTQQNPLLTVRANTSDRVDGYLTCTGYVDAGVEAVYVLDSTTGMLSAGVLSRNPKAPGFQATYQGNVNADLEKVITIASKMSNAGRKYNRPSSSSSSKRNRREAEGAAANNALMAPAEPKYIITSGSHDIMHQGSGIRPGASALYVTECNTGITLVYVLPWNTAAHTNNMPYSSPITYFTFYRFLSPMVMEEGADAD
ncbi:MAG: hypothetical protein K6C40_03905 [Thermoguttaceae bacterium]|nr:hypothetical protein [Thermoguttaceae bacterium]